MSPDYVLLIAAQLLFTTFIVGPSVIFYKLKKHPYIHNRQVNLVMLISFCAFWNGSNAIPNFNVFAGEDRVPCWVKIINQMISGPIFNFSILLRALVLFETAIVEQLKSNNFEKLTNFQIAVLKMFTSKKRHSSVSRTSISSKINWSVGAEKTQFGDIEDVKGSKPKFRPEFSNHIPNRILLLIFVGFVLLMLCLAAITFGLYPNNLDGPCIPEQFSFKIVVQLGIIVFTPFLFYLIKDVEDDYNLLDEIGLTSLVCLVLFTAYTIEHYKGVNIVSAVGPYFYVVIMFVIVHCISVIHPIWVVYSSSREIFTVTNNETVEVNRMEILLEILNSPSKSFKFKMLLKKQFCSENLLYYQKAQHANQVADDPVTLKIVLDEIYQNFVAEESPLELNLSASIRKDFVKAINQPNVGINTLDGITGEVLKMMLENSLHKYLKNEDNV